MSMLKRCFTALTAALCLTASALLAGPATAEAVRLPPDALRRTATDVVVGKVLAISQRTAMEGKERVTHYVAEVKVLTTEKGGSLKKGQRFAARYWNQVWTGPWRNTPLGSSGHNGLPIRGQTLRLYLARNAYDGFTFDNHDGGYNVIGPNGFEPLTPRRH